MTKKLNLGILYSGGKDSNYSMFLASKENIKCLISLKPKNEESYMFQVDGNEFIKYQSKAMEIPLILFETLGEKEKELDDLKEAIKIAINKYNINGIVTGAIESTYQASRIQKICDELDIYCFNPIWQVNDIDYLKKLENNFEIIIIKIASYPLTKEFLGKKLDKDLIIKLLKFKEKFGLSVIGEGGEFETFVLNSPLFKKRIKINKSKIIMDSENSGSLILENISLIEK